jgi:hypothetical protein
MELLLLMDPNFPSKNLQIDQHESSVAFKLEQQWVWRHDLDGRWRRMCWLPYKRRSYGEILACTGQRVIISAMHGLLTILDFSDV